MVSHTNASSAHILTQLIKPPIAQFTGCHLDAYFVQFCIFTRIKMCPMQFDSKLLAERHTKRLVPIRLSATQMEITMGSMYVETVLFQQQKQRYTIRTTT